MTSAPERYESERWESLATLLPASLIAKIGAKARAMNVTRPDVVRYAIEAFLAGGTHS